MNTETIISYITNCHGDEIPAEVLSCENGVLKLWRIVCYSSEDYGLGACRCVSHDSTEKIAITPEEVIRRFGEEALDGFDVNGHGEISVKKNSAKYGVVVNDTRR